MCSSDLCKTFVYEPQLSGAVRFFEIKDQPGIGPFGFVGIPGHMAVGNQPNNLFIRDQLRYGKVEERIVRHLHRKGITLFIGVSGKGYSPPFGYLADPFDGLVRADLCGDAAAEAVVLHFF